MAIGTSKEYLEKYRKEHKRGPNYPRFNLQAGDKGEQLFHIKLLPRILPKTDICDGPFHEYFCHYGCGPDMDQTLICINTTRDEMKGNKKRCFGCSETRKVSHDNEASEKQKEKAKRQSPRNRIMWPAYNLEDRKSVEMLDISAMALDEIISDHFQGPDGEHADLTDIRLACCLQIKRTGLGQYCKYRYKALFAPKWALAAEDAKNIKTSYLTPESVIDRKSLEEFTQTWTGSFDIQNEIGPDESAQIDPVSELDALANMGGESQTTKAAEGQRSRQRTETPAASPSADSAESLMSELEALGQ